VGHASRCHLLVGDFGEAQPGKDRLDSAGRPLPHRQRFLLANRVQASVHLHVALHHQIVVVLVAIEAAPAKEVVGEAGHGAVSRVHEIGTGDELAHELGRLADVGMARQGVVTGGHLQVQHGGQQVFGQDDAHAPG